MCKGTNCDGQIGSSARDARPDDPQNPPRPGSTARVGIARRIEQVSEDVLSLNEGTVYTSLLRLQQQGWIVAKWGVSESNRKARYYSITKTGLKQLAIETENWERISGVIARILKLQGEQ
jgi:PadR family transcriptional regulator, regulatory protein PadR